MNLDAHSCRGSPALSNIPMRKSSTTTSQDALLAPRSNQQISRLKSCLTKTPGASAVVSSGPMPLPSPFASRQEQVITIAFCCTASLCWDINMAQAKPHHRLRCCRPTASTNQQPKVLPGGAPQEVLLSPPGVYTFCLIVCLPGIGN